MKFCSRARFLLLFLLLLGVGTYFTFRQPSATRTVADANAAPEGVGAAKSVAAAAAAKSEEPASPDDSTSDDEPKADWTRWQFGTAWTRETDPRLAEFSKWADHYVKAGAADRAALEAEGIDLATQRRPAFKALIESNPKMALAMTVPASVRQELPPAILDQLESRQSGMGDLRLYGTAPSGDTAANTPFYRRVTLNGQTYAAHVYGSRQTQQTTSDISLHGVALDRELALSDSPLRVIEDGETLPGHPVADTSCPVSKKAAAPRGTIKRPGAVAAASGSQIHWLCRGGHIAAAADQITAAETAADRAAAPYRTLGSRKALFMMVDFTDEPGGAVRIDVATQRMNDVANFLQLNSYGQIQFTTRSITPIMRMPRSASYYADSFTGEDELLADARTASAANGLNSANYDFDVVVFADIGFLWGGLGYVGAKGSWVQGDFPAGTAAHELGHNLGLWHANSWVSSTIIGAGFHEEYGNVFDVMGRSSNFPNNHYNSNGKYLLNWLPMANILTVTGSGSATYRIYAHDMTGSLNSSRKYALRIPAGIPILGNDEDYWIDFRQLLSNRYSATSSGAIVQWGNDQGDDGGMRLLDMNPLTSSMDDAPLAIGRTFTDAGNSITVTTVAKGGAGADAYLDVQVARTILPPLTLAAALDTLNINWSSGAPSWTGQRNFSHDGVDAAQSGPAAHNGFSALDTDVVGPGVVSFWWSVSSEAGFDYLRLFVDNVEVAKISGESQWERKSIDIGPGSHHIQWRYTKDEFAEEGSDRGWVDQFEFTTGTRPPQITFQPLSLTVATGQRAEFRVEATGTDPLSFQWRKAGTSLPQQTNRTLVISNSQLADIGLYSVRITNAYGSAISSNALLSVVQTVALADALDFSGSSWSSFGNNEWIGQTNITQDGVDAAQSGTIAHNGYTVLDATVVGPGTLAFYWKVSSEFEYDYLSFYVDDILMDEMSGEVNWTQKTIQLTAGAHRISWVYEKDGSLTEGQDHGWVDNVRIAGNPNQKPVIAIPPQPVTVVQGAAANLSVVAGGSQPLSYYWYRDNTLVAASARHFGLGTPSLAIVPTDLPDAGNYSVVVSNSFGTATSAAAKLTITSAGALANALDLTQTWTSGGDAPWDAQFAVTHDGIDAAKSGLIAHGKQSWVETTFVGPGTVSFWSKISSEAGFDFLDVSVDGVSVTSLSGEINWTNVLVSVNSGGHRVRWTYRKDSAGSAGSDAVWLDQVTFAAGANLADALDLPNGQWQTGGAAGWVSVSDNTADGIDAARSGVIGNSQETWFQSTFVGPGVVSFKWRVSSEQKFDTLRVDIDSVKQAEISGATAWASTNVVVPAGSHVVRWTYAKDNADRANADRAWVDQVSFEQRVDLNTALDAGALVFANSGAANWFGVGAPSHDGVDAAQSGTIGNNQETKLQAAVAGPGSISFWWKVSSEQNFDVLKVLIDGEVRDQISGEQNWARRAYTLTPGAHTIAWVYSKDGADRVGADAGWIDEVVFAGAVDLAQAVDTTGLTWTTGGASPWVGQTAISHDAADSAVSGTLAHGQESWMQTTVTGPVQLGFWWKVSSEQNGDYFSVRIDGAAPAARISGNVDWVQQTIAVPAGSHTIRWQYQKDSSVSAGEDRAWLDQVTTGPGGTATPPRLAITRSQAGSVDIAMQQLSIGASVALDVSTNLTVWTPVSTNTANATNMTITRPAGATREYLRARVLP
jgi:hypothetical protein